MCGIVISKDKKQFIDLLRINRERRGSDLYSVVCLNDDFRPYMVYQDTTLFTEDALSDAFLYIGHTQAPTQNSEETWHQPSALSYGSFLFHNGIIKSSFLSRIGRVEEWDTYVLHSKLENTGFEALNDIDGSFSCVYIKDNRVYLFRTSTCSMWKGKDYFSSEKIDFDVDVMIESGKVYTLDADLNLKQVDEFKEVSTPYYFN